MTVHERQIEKDIRMRATVSDYGTRCGSKLSIPGLHREEYQPVPYRTEADKPSEVVVEQGE